MGDKFAIKRLTRSDLTFFKSLFETLHAGNQKAINLNADVFIDRLYPSLPAIAHAEGSEIPLALSILGPGLQSEHRLMRKVIKGSTYKNWRLNGEFIDNPEDNPIRYNSLTAGDYAAMVFHGDPKPSNLELLLVSSNDAEDAHLHAAIAAMMANRSMVEIDRTQLFGLAATAGVSALHPINEIFLDEALEDAALGGNVGTQTLLSRPSGQKLTLEQLEKARKAASRNGEAGEEFVCVYLNTLKSNGTITDFEWVSRVNAVAPYDFAINTPHGDVNLDVKSTAYGFDRPLHVSINELREMVHSGNRYDLYRVYELAGSTAKLRICEDFRPVARSIIDSLAELPEGVTPDSFSIKPGTFTFGAEIILTLLEDEQVH